MSKILFLAYKEVSARTKRLSQELGAKLFSLREDFPYFFSILFTFLKILKEKPKVVILQLTQGPPLFFLILLKRFLKFNLILDIHTGFLIYVNIKGKLLNKPFVSLLKFANLIILHNKTISKVLNQNILKKSIIIKDPLLKIEVKPINKPKYFVIFTTLTFSGDEPIELLLKIAENLRNEALFIYTSKSNINLPNMKNIGYLKYSDYLRVLKSVDLVLAMTKREFTSLSLAYEAISLNKALICSWTLALEETYHGKVILAKTLEEYLKAIRELMNEEKRRKYEEKIRNLAEILKEEERISINRLCSLISKI